MKGCQGAQRVERLALARPWCQRAQRVERVTRQTEAKNAEDPRVPRAPGEAEGLVKAEARKKEPEATRRGGGFEPASVTLY